MTSSAIIPDPGGLYLVCDIGDLLCPKKRSFSEAIETRYRHLHIEALQMAIRPL